jgi:CheY-like chemotaxis protein
MGSTFTATVLCEVSAEVLLPTLDTEPSRPPEFSDSGWLTLGARVLLVEDNPVNVVVAEAMLRNLGYEVHTVGDGQQAVHWLSHRSCDVVLMDCAMPVMDGFDATREIRRRELQLGASRVPVVALTAHLAAEERERCRDAGMDDFLSKPFDADDLQRVVERCLTQGALLRTL